MKTIYSLFLAAVLIIISFNQAPAQIKGLSGWNIFLDPGHSQSENMGIFGYPEAHKVLRVGLNLRDLLLSKTDIDTVYISRTNDQQNVSLTQRTDYANSVGAAWYHSIHSDAGSPGANSTLLLWGQYSNGLEKIPNGGKAMSDAIVPILTAGYRTTTRGSYGDCTFYGCSTTGPYLFVNRESNMPSELSEAGFHTNPKQNQLNMNSKWKRLEAYTLFWSILKYFNINRPFAGIATGIIIDGESGKPVNGAVISLDGQTDTTDTYESLFHLYSNDSEQLRNGFYFFENLSAGTFTVTVQAKGYEAYSGSVAISDTFFTFDDIQLISSVPPFVASISPTEGDSIYPGIDNIQITFSRPMNETSVESTLTIFPAVPVNLTWSDDDATLTINTSCLNYNTSYQLKISGHSTDAFNHPFDGNGDSTGGDDFILTFKTKVKDVSPPALTDVYPATNMTGVELNPIISLSFDENINASAFSGQLQLIKDSDQTSVNGIIKYYIVNGRGVLNLFIRHPLAVNQNYTFKLAPGIQDIYGNEIKDQFTSGFTTGDQQFTIVNNIDNFEGGTGNWWAPQQSGNTTGIITELTGISSTSTNTNFVTGSSRSMMLTYGWDTTVSTNLIREYFSGSSSSFNSSDILQVYIFGDGSGNQFRFAVKDNSNSIEVSPWYTLNWIGWKLINWDMTNDGIGTWIGNDVLENPLRFDSFQLTFIPGNKISGEIYFDDLRIVNKTTVGIPSEVNNNIPSDYSLGQNYPNPFNPSTQIKFGIPQSGFVRLEVFNILGQKVSTLIDKEMNTGYHVVNYDAEELASGIYIYTLSVNNFITSRKMLFLK